MEETEKAQKRQHERLGALEMVELLYLPAFVFPSLAQTWVRGRREEEKTTSIKLRATTNNRLDSIRIITRTKASEMIELAKIDGYESTHLLLDLRGS